MTARKRTDQDVHTTPFDHTQYQSTVHGLIAGITILCFAMLVLTIYVIWKIKHRHKKLSEPSHHTPQRTENVHITLPFSSGCQPFSCESKTSEQSSVSLSTFSSNNMLDNSMYGRTSTSNGMDSSTLCSPLADTQTKHDHLGSKSSTSVHRQSSISPLAEAVLTQSFDMSAGDNKSSFDWVRCKFHEAEEQAMWLPKASEYG